MPSFSPPLGQTTFASYPDLLDNTSYLQLNFTAEIAQGERVEGVYELWTDIEDLDQGGVPKYPAREWHSIPYVPYSDASREILIATPVISPRHASFSYTLRLVKPSGEIAWLGSGGDNGTIVVQQRQDALGLAMNGEWKGLERTEYQGWTAYAVQMRDQGRTVVYPLPSSTHASADIIIAKQSWSPTSQPFARVISTPISVQRNSLYLAIVGGNEGVPVPPHSTFPSSSARAHFARGAVLGDALRNAIGTNARIGITSSSPEVVELSSPEPIDTSRTLVIISDVAAPTTHTITREPADIHAPQLFEQDGMVKSTPPGKGSAIELLPGLAATKLTMSTFVELRDAGDANTLWICGDGALLLQVGEEEMEDDAKPIVHVPASPAQIARSASRYNDAQESTALGIESNPASEESTHEHGTENDSVGTAQDDDKDDDDTDTIRPVKSEQGSVFQWIGRLFVKLLSWLLSPFQNSCTEGDDTNRARVSTDREVTPERQASASDMDERTPLLSTPGLSRSTSSSAYSPLASPSSLSTIKAAANLESLLDRNQHDSGIAINYGHSTPEYGGSPERSRAGFGTESPMEKATKSLAAPHVSIKSFARFGLTGLPPFAFYLHQTGIKGGDISVELKVAIRKLGENAWRQGKVQAVDSDTDDGVKQITVQLASCETVDKGKWQVEVARV